MVLIYEVRICVDTSTTQSGKLTYIYPTIQSNLRSLLRKFYCIYQFPEYMLKYRL